MPMKLLLGLSRSRLPVSITEPQEIDKLRLLRAAGLVAALLPGVRATAPVARVLAITRKGRQELQGPAVCAAPRA